MYYYNNKFRFMTLEKSLLTCGTRQIGISLCVAFTKKMTVMNPDYTNKGSRAKDL